MYGIRKEVYSVHRKKISDLCETYNLLNIYRVDCSTTNVHD